MTKANEERRHGETGGAAMWCEKCGTPICLALVRVDTHPANWMDLLDRQFKLISSGHWGVDQVGYLFAAVAMALLVVSVFVVTFALAGPIWTGVIGLGAATPGTVWTAKKLLNARKTRRRQRASN
ncbi:hypothetical protein [Nocardia nova]|uniref:hypothetical protein n=1 Tax=Nocardia nova TaxID=37330 RepID=UPI0033C0BD73